MALFEQHKNTGVVEMFHEHAADADSYFETPFISSVEIVTPKVESDK